ncbi:unnamed protein product [Musa textilis]
MSIIIKIYCDQLLFVKIHGFGRWSGKQRVNKHLGPKCTNDI